MCRREANPQAGSRFVAASGRGRGRRAAARRDVVCFGEDRYVLELDGEDARTALPVNVAAELCTYHGQFCVL